MQQHRRAHAGIEKPATILGLIVDYGIAGILFLAPLAMGGRYELGRLVLLLLVGLVSGSWFLDRVLNQKTQRWTWTHAEWLCGLALLLVVLQLTPLSSAWVQRLSPHTAELLPMWFAGSDQAAWPTWNRITFSPQATRGGLAMLLGYATLFLVLVQRIQGRREVERILKAVALAGVAMASLGLLQYLIGNGKFLWFYEHPSRDTLTAVKGTFANENHFAHFLALTIGPLLWWLVRSQKEGGKRTKGEFQFGPLQSRPVSRVQVLLTMGLGVVSLATLLTYSRGGIAMVLLAATVSVGLFAWFGQVGRRSVIAVGSVVVISAIAIWIHGQDLLAREIKTIQTASLESLDEGGSRRKIWAAVTKAIPHFAVVGSGVGTHREVYPTYFSEESSVVYTHAESGYLQVLLETGMPGFCLLLAGMALTGLWLYKAIRTTGGTGVRSLAVPIVASCSVSAVHALADFNWYIPANMSVLLVLLAATARLHRLAVPKTAPVTVPRVAWIATSAIVIMCSVFSIQHYLAPARAAEHYNEYLAWSLASNRFRSKSIGPGRQRRLGLVDGTSPEAVSQMAHHLDESLRRNPRNGQANVRMAAMCLRLFEIRQKHSRNAMSLAQIRDAALTSGFESHEQMSAWVTRAVGENRALLDRALLHARRGVRLAPLLGRGYLYLAEVAFLDGSLEATPYELSAQAFAVRPYDPSVQFLLGRQKLMAGDQEGAMALWKEAFRRGPDMRRRVIEALGLQAHPDELIAVFQPDVHGLRDMFDFYRRQALEPQVRIVGERYVAALVEQAELLTGRLAAELWFDAQFVYTVLGEADKAADAAVACAAAEPQRYENHFAAAIRLREAGRLEEALREFRWCELRRPQDSGLKKVVFELHRQISQSARTSSVGERPAADQGKLR